jgi:hypothetical protein
MPCDVKLLSKRTDRGVRARGARRDNYTHSVASGGNGFGIGICCFNGAADTTEQIHLVSHLKNILVQPDGLGRPPSEFENFVRRRIAPAQRAGGDIGRWVAVRMHFGHHCARCG